MKKKLVIILAVGCIVLGTVGIFIPLLPTTPFLLLAAWLFLKSSPKLYTWLVHNRIYGMYIKNYVERKAVPLKIKLFTIIVLWGVIMSTVVFTIELLWLRIVLIVIAIAVTTHILLIRPNKRS